MSDAGLYGGIYDQLRRYADRLDRDLILLRGTDPGTATLARKDIAELLRTLAAHEPARLPDRLAAVVLRNELGRVYGEAAGTFEQLALSLDAGGPSAGDIAKLEAIAAAIDRGCSDAMARLRGKS